jgi:hypothetical protein
MAMSNKPRGRFWSRLHFVLRFLGLTGLLAAGAGAILAGIWGLAPAWERARSTGENLRAAWEFVRTTAHTHVQAVVDKQPFNNERVIVGLILVGGAFAVLALFVEVIGVLFLVAGRRSAFGGNVVLQIALALALLVGVNVFAHLQGNYRRIDTTRDHLFTLPEQVQKDLRKLQGETTVVVYQMHQPLGFLPAGEKRDRYESAAERKVIEKVDDLVEQFREFGGKFKVVVLDSQEEDFDTQRQALPEELRQAIDKAPEDSIFFAAGGKVQRMSFNEFYALDRVASEEGRGNLVLRYHGAEAFAERVLNIDERRPRVAVGTVHPLLSLQGGSTIWGMAGVKKALESNGFETRDILLKKEGPGDLEPATYTFEEGKLEQLDDDIASLQEAVTDNDTALKGLEKRREEWAREPLSKLADSELGRSVKRELEITSDKDFTENVRKQVLASLDEQLGMARTVVPAMRERFNKELESLRKEREGVAKAEEPLAEQRRLSDIRAKTARLLADCDMLILPRATLFDVVRGPMIPYSLYKLDPGQVSAIRDFVRSGKPLLVCFGPSNAPPTRPDPDAAGSDALEEMLAGLGLHLSRQTVLFNVETKSFGQRRSGLVIGGTTVEVPPLRLDAWQPGTGLPASKQKAEAELPANPLRESLRLTARGLGKGGTLDLRLRCPRPVYYDAQLARLPGVMGMWTAAPGAGLGSVSWGSLFLFDRPARSARFAPEFLMTDADSWNENQPFPTRERTPHYEPPKGDEQAGDPFDAKRVGPFPIGVAVEVPNWYSTTTNEAPPLRVVAVGQGGLFIAPELSPAREKLLLDTCNWLLGRDAQLTRAGEEWKYPRVALEPRERLLWVWGVVGGLPLLFAYLGLVVVMKRRTR